MKPFVPHSFGDLPDREPLPEADENLYPSFTNDAREAYPSLLKKSEKVKKSEKKREKHNFSGNS